MTPKQKKALVSLAGITIWNQSHRRFITRLWYKFTENKYIKLTKPEYDILFHLAFIYLPKPISVTKPNKGIHRLTVTIKCKNGYTTYNYWQSWIQHKNKKIRVGCFPYTEKGLQTAKERLDIKRKELISEAIVNNFIDVPVLQ